MRDKKILIVDDEADIRELLAIEMERQGAQVLEAEGGEAAFALLQQNHVDLIISDVRMPTGDGIELLERVQKLDNPVPVILISGFADITREEALAKGALNLQPKPLDWQGLQNDVQTALRD